MDLPVVQRATAAGDGRKGLAPGEMRLGHHRTEATSEQGLRCSYCGKEPNRRRKLVQRGDGRYICTECTERVIAELASEATKDPRPH